MDGDIIVFEKEEKDEHLELPTCPDYFNYIFHKVKVNFIDKTAPNDPGFVFKHSFLYTFNFNLYLLLYDIL